MEIILGDVQVQGEPAPEQIASAITRFNELPDPPDVLLITRGGGSADDLQAFNTEIVNLAVAGSRIPTMVAIGHEVDFSLAELAADVRASTPSNAAEMLVPDRKHEQAALAATRRELATIVEQVVKDQATKLTQSAEQFDRVIERYFERLLHDLETARQILTLVNPRTILKRGYVLVRDGAGSIIRSATSAKSADSLLLEFADDTIQVKPGSKL
jgi:exodeoxyribonuclease VII large subunit